MNSTEELTFIQMQLKLNQLAENDRKFKEMIEILARKVWQLEQQVKDSGNH